MRDMEDIIILHGLYEQCRNYACCDFDLHPDPEMDESSDAEDPEAEAKEAAKELKQEAADMRAFIEAMPGYLENRSLLTELERARMQLEDHYSERFRSMS